MSRLKIPAFGLIAVVVVIIGSQLTTAAYAETVDLSCTASPNGARNLYVSIDTSASTATFWENGSTREQGPKNPATITDQKVTWRWSLPTGYQGGLVEDFTFDRNTGALSNVVTNNGRTSTNSWTCKRAERVF